MGYDMMDALEIAKRFDLDGEPVDAKPYGCGHINDTYCVYCHREEKTSGGISSSGSTATYSKTCRS